MYIVIHVRVHTGIEQEFDHLKVALVAGECERALFELIGVSVDVSAVVKEQLRDA